MSSRVVWAGVSAAAVLSVLASVLGWVALVGFYRHRSCGTAPLPVGAHDLTSSWSGPITITCGWRIPDGSTEMFHVRDLIPLTLTTAVLTPLLLLLWALFLLGQRQSRQGGWSVTTR